MIVKSKKIDGLPIEVHEKSFGARRYWATVDGAALFQRGRMRVREFETMEAAWKAALAKAQTP